MGFLRSALFLVLACMAVHCMHEDNEFAEFEDFDDEMFESPPSKDAPHITMAPEAATADDDENEDGGDDDDATIDDEDEEEEDRGDVDDEFSHLGDKDEFEGFSDKKSSKPPGDIQFVKVPVHLHTSWEHYSLEVLMLAGLLAYLLNYLAGKARNQKLAEAWFSAHKQLLEENFCVVGDDGVGTEVGGGGLLKETDNVFTLWCSGRTCCEGMLVTIKLLKRQDLVSVISSLLRPAFDQIQVRVEMGEGEMEMMVFCLAHKRVMNKLQKEQEDLATFCGEKKSGDKLQLPSHLQVLSESQEVAAFVLDAKVSAAVKRYEEVIEYMHFSDQYSSYKNTDDSQPTKSPEKSKVLLFCFNVSSKQGREMEDMRPLMQMVLYLLDKLKRLKLSKEAKLKAERSRQRALEMVVKAGHVSRSEAAQNRKEERKRLVKEKIMNEDDPDKQRKLEEKNLKKEAKKNQPRMKRMKIKSM